MHEAALKLPSRRPPRGKQAVFLTSVVKRPRKIHIVRTCSSLHVPAVTCGNSCLLSCLLFES